MEGLGGPESMQACSLTTWNPVSVVLLEHSHQGPAMGWVLQQQRPMKCARPEAAPVLLENIVCGTQPVHGPLQSDVVSSQAEGDVGPGPREHVTGEVNLAWPGRGGIQADSENIRGVPMQEVEEGHSKARAAQGGF